MKTYLVGGAVRDQLLNYPYRERDWVVVGASAGELLSLGYEQVGKDFPVFLHPVSKEEYALARTERKSGKGYTGFKCISTPEVTLEQDLLRRDLTINAMAQDSQGDIIDPYGGQQDLRLKILRHVSDAFVEDPLRVLRVARFSARYAHIGFTVASETLSLMRSIADSGELDTLPQERIWKEFERALAEKNPEQFLLVLRQCNALEHLIPEFNSLSERSMTALIQASKTHSAPAIRFALLFVDIDADTTKMLCKRIKAPKPYRELAVLVSDFADQLGAGSIPADKQLLLMEATDAFRKPKRFNDFLTSCAILFNNQRLVSSLNSSLQAATSIDANELVARGLRGKQIAKTLRQQRLKAITYCIQGAP